MRKHLTGFGGHAKQQHRSYEELDKSFRSAALNVLVTVAIIMAAIAIAILVNILHIY